MVATCVAIHERTRERWIPMMYDLAVVGCGGMGSSVLYHAAKAGAQVIGLDKYAPPHHRGSSHGATRIIRQAYFEHPDYVPLLLEAYQDWADLEREASQKLFFQTGLLQVGPPEGEVVPGVLRSAQEHGLDVDHWSYSDLVARFPQFRFDPRHEGAFESKAGYLLVEACVATYLHRAIARGAHFHPETEVLHIDSKPGFVDVTTSRGSYSARKVIVAAGPWLAGELLAELGFAMPLQPLIKHLHWFKTDELRFDVDHPCPLYLFELDHGCFYGFPRIDSEGIKVAEHSGGEPTNGIDGASEAIESQDLERVTQFLEDHLVGQFEHRRHQRCFYTMTQDHHFWIDQNPNDPNLFVMGGFSGHGFKFASVLGKCLVRWALQDDRDDRLQLFATRA